MATQEISDYVNGLSSATLVGTEELYLDTDEKCTVDELRTYISGGYATKTINIGAWNMDTNDNVSVAHGVADFTKIRSIYVIILSDIFLNRSNLSSIDAATGLIHGGVGQIGAVNLALERTIGGSYDSPSYDDGAMNRGFITITYEL
jgi:hypothetical protein